MLRTVVQALVIAGVVMLGMAGCRQDAAMRRYDHAGNRSLAALGGGYQTDYYQSLEQQGSAAEVVPFAVKHRQLAMSAHQTRAAVPGFLLVREKTRSAASGAEAFMNTPGLDEATSDIVEETLLAEIDLGVEAAAELLAAQAAMDAYGADVYTAARPAEVTLEPIPESIPEAIPNPELADLSNHYTDFMPMEQTAEPDLLPEPAVPVIDEPAVPDMPQAMRIDEILNGDIETIPEPATISAMPAPAAPILEPEVAAVEALPAAVQEDWGLTAQDGPELNLDIGEVLRPGQLTQKPLAEIMISAANYTPAGQDEAEYVRAAWGNNPEARLAY